MSEPPPYRLHQSLGYQLSVAARIQERRLDEGLKPLGLTRITWCALLAVGNEGLTQPSDIAAFVGIDRTATSRALRQMEADGMIERTGGTADRRTTRVMLTPKGEELIRRGTPLALENNRIMTDRLTADELDQLTALLHRIRTGDTVQGV